MHKHKCPVCDSEINLGDGQRSVPHLRRFFLLVKLAYEHWPEVHPVQFDSAMEARRYLTMLAGHREIAARIPLEGLDKERAKMLAEAAIRSVGQYAIPTFYKGDLVIWTPKSISFGKLGHKDAVKLFQDVAEVIYQETGIDPQTLMEQADAP